MQKRIFIILFLLLINSITVYAFELSAESAVLYEPVTNRVIFEKNKDEKLPMASTTKIATCITALEYGNLNDVVIVSKNAADTEGSSMWLEEGEQILLSDLLYGLMLSSGNDAAVAIAEHIGGSEKKFARLMNETAYKAAAYNTNFINPNGLDHENHYTTAYDLAKITAYAMKNNLFREIVSTSKKSLPWQGHEWNRVLSNHNKMLKMYDGCNGVKTGFTKKSGRCLVTSAERGNINLIAVTLNASDDWNDHKKMLDFGFEQISVERICESGRVVGKIPVIDGNENEIECIISENFNIPIIKNDDIETNIVLKKEVIAPVIKGEVMGYIEIFLNNELIENIDIIANSRCEKEYIPTLKDYIILIFKNILK